MERILGLDVGTKRIGVALSDPLGIVAQPLTTIERESRTKDLQAVEALLLEYGVKKVVVGMPFRWLKWWQKKLRINSRSS
jgi:putative Holliday junction resolvase